MKRITLLIKFTAVGFIFIILLLVLFPLEGTNSSLKTASADSLDAYPSVCLGGWQNPGNAAGTPDVAQGSAAFNDGNSAVLDQTQAQIFCGSFQGSDESQQPQAVTLHLSWMVIFPGVSGGGGGGGASDVSAGSDSTSSDASSWSSVLDSTSSATSTAPTESSTAPASASTSDQSDTSTTTSLLQNILRDPFALLVPRTFADSSGTVATDTDTNATGTDATSTLPSTSASTTTSTVTSTLPVPSDGFIDVSYSLDGTTWTDLGEVSAAEWQDFAVTIPVSSWSDIQNLQIQLSPVLTSNPPTIYLDGMWLQVDYNQSVLGVLQDGADAALNAAADLGNAIGTALNNVANDLTSAPGNSSSTAENTQSPVAPPAHPAPAAHRYSFQTGSGLSADPKDLSWVPAEDLKQYDASATAANQGQLPTVTVVDQNSLRVAGTCSEVYYTILLFANPGDYKTNPASALFNEAQPCVNGSFAQVIADSDLPSQLASGTYYLVVANQPAKGPWQPFPQIYPITIGNVASSSQ